MAWGGTGGHVFPIKSLIQFLDKRPVYLKQIANIYRFGSPESLEYTVTKELQQETRLTFVPICAGKFRRETRRRSRLKNVRDIFLFGIGFFQSLFRLVRYNIDVVFCKWGFVALPVVLAAKVLQRQIVVHESDTHPGLVNKLASRCTDRVFTGFDDVLPHSKTIGQIISDDIIGNQQEVPLFTPPQISPKTKVLVVWGSLGSQGLYTTMLSLLENHAEVVSWFEFYFILGLLSQEMSTKFAKFPNVYTKGFVSQKEMGKLYDFCDIAITRGGTTSLAEQKLYDMKQIIIPIPWTHDQYDNAQRYVQHHNDIMINQRDKGFDINILNTLIKLRNFTKKVQKKDRFLLVSQAKDIIWKALLKGN